jgi:hypothetical protein
MFSIANTPGHLTDSKGRVLIVWNLEVTNISQNSEYSIRESAKNE